MAPESSFKQTFPGEETLNLFSTTASGYGDLLDTPLETERILGALTSSTKLAKHGIALTHSTNSWSHFSAQPNGAIFRLRFDDGFVAANVLFHLAMSCF